MASRRPYTLPWFTGLLSKRHATKRKHKDEVETETLSEAASASTELATDEHTRTLDHALAFQFSTAYSKSTYVFAGAAEQICHYYSKNSTWSNDKG